MELTVMLLCGALIFIIVIILFRAMKAEDRSIPAPGPNPDRYLSERAAESLSAMIRYRTVEIDRKSSKFDTTEYDTTEYDSTEFESGDELKKLKEYLRSRYLGTFELLRTEEINGHMLLRWRGTDEDSDPILFCVNTDVLSADGAWEFGPFSGEIAEERVWGRGAIESKGVLCAVLEAIESLVAEGFAPKRDIYVSILHNSESGGSGASDISELFRKRAIRFAAVFEKGACISKDLLPINRPQAVIGVAEKGRLQVRLTSLGKGGRSAFPPRYTAVGRLSEAICRIEFRPCKIRRSVVQRDMIESFAPYMAFNMRVLAANLWLFEGLFYRSMLSYASFSSMLRTTFAATDIHAGTGENKLPETAKATIQIRTIHGDSCSDIYRYIVNLVDSLGVQADALFAEDASQVSPYKGKEYAKLKNALTESLGDMAIAPGIIADKTSSVPYGSYANAVYRITPFILTEAEKETIHGANERIAVEALGRAVEFYRKLIQAVAE